MMILSELRKRRFLHGIGKGSEDCWSCGLKGMCNRLEKLEALVRKRGETAASINILKYLAEVVAKLIEFAAAPVFFVL